MTEPTTFDHRKDAEVRDKLISARVGLLLKAPFFGNLSTRLRLVNADEWCPSAATDGRNFYYNTDFVNSLRPGELQFLFGHEVLHCIYDHIGRTEGRHKELSNIAQDYAVNRDLREHNVGEFITSVPCLYDSKYDGLVWEEIYDRLLEECGEQGKKLQKLLDQLIDQHLDSDEGDGEGEGEGDNSGKGKPKISEADRRALRDELIEAMLSAASTCTDPGQIPAGVRRMIKDLTEPKMNWRELIRATLESMLKTDFTWMRASRKGWHMDAIMPGMKVDPKLDLVVFLDASGSISSTMLKDFLSEIAGIMEQFPNYQIHVATFDTEVYNGKDYDNENLESIAEYEISGGGGTDFESMYSYMKEKDIQPKRMVVFTDGYPCGSWGEENYADVLWVIHGTESIVPPFGQYAYYTE